MANRVGGKIEEFGEVNVDTYTRHPKRPAVKMADVFALARTSFNISTFKSSVLPCTASNMVRPETCQLYDSQKSCRRPKAEFLGRHYDTPWLPWHLERLLRKRLCH